MTLGNVVNQLHDEHCLSYTGTTKESDLTTFHIRFEQVDNLNTCGKDLFLCRELLERRSRTVNGIGTLHVELFHTVDRLTDHVQHSTLNLITGRHHDRCAHRDRLQTTLQTISIVHCHTTYGILTDMLLHLDDKFLAVGTNNLKSFVDLGEHFLCIQSFGIEINIDNRTNNLRNASFNLCHKRFIFVS